MAKNVKVTQQSATGLNQRFYDPVAHRSMTRPEFVKQIESGNYKGYHVAKLNGLKVPRSNPDQRKANKLGLR